MLLFIRPLIGIHLAAYRGGSLLPGPMINCVGCRIDGVKTPYCEALCPIRQCALDRNVETCGSCSDMKSCEKLGAIIENNASAYQNLKG